MEFGSNREILFISHKGGYFGVEFPYIAEICSDVQISRIPCLPEYFNGVYNYKGTIIPVIGLEESKNQQAYERQEEVILVIRHEKFQFGISFDGEPGILALDEAQKMENPEETVFDGIWHVKDMFKQNGQIYSVLDIERTARELVVFK